MSRKLDAADAGETSVLSIRLTPRVLAALKAETARRSAAAGGVPLSDAAVGRTMIERALGLLVEPTLTAAATPARAQGTQRTSRARTPDATAEQYTDDELRAVVQAAATTERARAAAVGVSPSMVHRFLNGGSVSTKTRATLVQYAGARGGRTE